MQDSYTMVISKDDMNKTAIFSLVAILSFIIASNPVFGQTNTRPFNWLQFCRSPVVDSVVAEPCQTLTTSDGYALTKEGQRVMGCFLGAGLLLAADPTGKALLSATTLAQSAHLCGGITGPSGAQKTNPLNNLVNNLFGR
jgi:hypothetical protein